MLQSIEEEKSPQTSRQTSLHPDPSDTVVIRNPEGHWPFPPSKTFLWAHGAHRIPHGVPRAGTTILSQRHFTFHFVPTMLRFTNPEAPVNHDPMKSRLSEAVPSIFSPGALHNKMLRMSLRWAVPAF